ncbi:18744_t:CDS:1 [Acaulospora morrowiae]|uniref:18744_t:CDS:1 n=1 Tax=Acaulospora morrowiae TaxID=94023 RepID=A0A9N8V9L4_9GLOM|nr:18744_t:CDS:1 [Acaulospora morrowiae]
MESIPLLTKPVTALNGPAQSDYEIYNPKTFFSYPPNGSGFQTGFLGVGPSIVSGGFHIKYPKNQPLKISKITLSLIGGEVFSYSMMDSVHTVDKKFFESTLDLWESADHQDEPISDLDLRFRFRLDDDLPPSLAYNNIAHNVSTCGILYILEATLYNHQNSVQGVYRSIKLNCPITRWNLPNKIKQSIELSQLSRPEYNRKWNISKGIDDIIYSANLDYKWYAIGSTLEMPIALVLPCTSMSVKEVHAEIKEYHVLQDKGYCVHVTKQKVFSNTFKGKEFSKVENTKNKYLLTLKLKIPSNNIIPDFDDDTRELNHVQLVHQLKIRIKFGSFKTLVLKKQIAIKNTLDKKKLCWGIKNGLIYS